MSAVLVVGPAIQGGSAAFAATPDAAAMAPGAVQAQTDVVREIVESRTEYSRSYLLTNGNTRVEYSYAPLHYFNPTTKRLEPIDVSLEETVSAGRAIKTNRANAFKLELPSNLSNDWVTIKSKGRRVSMRPTWNGRPGQAAVPPGAKIAQARAATTLEYPTAFTEARLEYESMPDGLKETIVLDAPPSETTFSFELALDGLEPRLEEDGSISLCPPNGAEPAFRIPAPFMIDSSGSTVGDDYSDDVEYKIREQNGSVTLDVVASQAWLTDPGRVYPVRIDPTIAPPLQQTQTGGNDTFISSKSGNQGTNYISHPLVWINNHNPSANWTEYGYIQPHGNVISDMQAKLASGLKVAKSQLKLYAQPAYVAVPGMIYGRMGKTNADTVLTSLTWSTYSAGAGAYEGSLNKALDVTVGSSGGWSFFDVSDMVAYWQSQTLPQKRCTLRLSASTGAHVGYNSADATSNKPVWIIEYANPPEVTLTSPTTGPVTELPKATWTFEQAQGSMQSAYLIEVSTSTAGPAIAQLQETGDATSLGLPQPEGGYRPGNTYHVRVKVASKPADTGGVELWSDWSDWGSFTPSVPSTVTTLSAEATVGAGWFSAQDEFAQNETNAGGRGSAVLQWAPSTSADGYNIYLYDGRQYQRVGATLGEDATTWSTKGAQLFPHDSDIDAWTSPYNTTPFIGASSPSVDSALSSADAPSGCDLRTVVGNNSSLFTRRQGSDGKWRWVELSWSGVLQKTFASGDDLTDKLSYSGFYANQMLWNGYADAPDQVTGTNPNYDYEPPSGYGIASTGDTNPPTAPMYFTRPMLDRSSGATLTAPSGNILLAATPQGDYTGTKVFSIGAGIDGEHGAGFTIREYKLPYRATSGGSTAEFVCDYTVETESFELGGAIVTPETLLLIEDDTPQSQHRVLKLSRGQNMAVTGQWVADMASTGATNGCWVKDGDGSQFVMGARDLSKLKRYAGTGLELRDAPNRLYKKTCNASDEWYSRNDYRFVVMPFDADFGEPAFSDDTSVTVVLDNRTVDVSADPRHVAYDLADMANHDAEVGLDTASLNLEITDLDVASYGPDASLSRHYSSRDLLSPFAFAPGWRFDFERHLEIDPQNDDVTYVDEDGERRVFREQNGEYFAPAGYHATLKLDPNGLLPNTYTLSFKDRTHLEFKVSGDEAFLDKEVDRNDQRTSYSWSGGFLWFPQTLTIKAANAQEIGVVFDSNRIKEATYRVGDVTRRVTYDCVESGTDATATVTYHEAVGSELQPYQIRYVYQDSHLVSMDVPETRFAGQEAKWAFAYDMSRLSGVTAPSGQSTTTIGFDYDWADDSATIVRSAEVSGTEQDVYQTYGWNPTGTLAYRSNERLDSETSSFWRYEYSTSNEAIRETSPTGKLQQRDLDVRGNVLAEHDEDHHVVSYTYETVSDDFGIYDQIRTKMDPRGNITRYAYDEHGNIESVQRRLTYAEESDSRYEYDEHGRQTKERTLLWERDGVKKWLVEEKGYDVALKLDEPETVTQRAEIEENGQLSEVPIDLGNGQSVPSITTTTIHDAFGNVVREIDAANVVTMDQALYSTFGKLMSSVDVEGVTTNNRYDALGRLVETSSTVSSNSFGPTVANWNVTEVDVDGRTVREESRAANGAVNTWTEYAFDAAGRGVCTTDSVAGVSATWFDARGNAVATWEPGTYDAASPDLSKATRARYELDGTNTWACDAGKPDSAAVLMQYRPDGLLEYRREADGSWTRYVYDAGDNLAQEISPTEVAGVNASSLNVYDAGGRLFETKSAEGMVTRTYYDLADRPVLSVMVDGVGASQTETTATATVFNEVGLELSSTDADGIVTKTGYDVLGNVLIETTVDSSGIVASEVHYEYDSKKRLKKKITTEKGVDNSVTYAYDPFGRIVDEKHMVGDKVGSKWEKTWYDEYDRPTRIVDQKRDVTRDYTYSGGAKKKSTERLTYGSVVTTTTVNEFERETANSSTFALASGQVDLVRNVDWDEVRGFASTSTLSVGAGTWVTQYTYDLGDKLKGISGGLWGASGVSATYNAATATKQSDAVTLPWGGATTRSFEYTNAGRLKKVTQVPPGGGSRQIAYVWDDEGTGDLKSFTDAGVTTTLTYEGGQLQTRARSGSPLVTYEYDSGRRTRAATTGGGSVETSWTADDRLTSWVKKGTSGSIEASAAYEYDADGQRTKATVFAANPWSQTATETVYAYGWDGLELRWMKASSDAVEARLTYLYDEADRPYAASYEATVSGEPMSAVFELMTTDHGDVVGLADVEGTQFARYAYGPFGEPETKPTDYRSTQALTSELARQIFEFQPLRYASYDYDPWSETYYLQARHYDPATKQFLSKDPAEADGEESAYQYCAGDPINQDDPDGEFAQVLWGAVGGAAWYAGGQAIKGAWKAKSVFKKRGFKAGMRATWKNVKKSWSWKQFGKEVAIGAATGGLGKLAKAGKLAKYANKARSGARVGRCRVLSKGSRYLNKVSRGKIPAKTFCFVAGTPVVTPSGNVAIETIRPGDLVMSRDAVTGQTAAREVEQVFVNRTTELVHIGVADETISASPSHPFWVEGTGWVEADELVEGMEVSLASGERATITSVVREHLASPTDVYNFQVADFHTYFVASAGVWVHNSCTQSVKGVTRGQHRYHANKQVYEVLQKGGKAAKKLRRKYGDDAIDEFIANRGRKNIRGTQWHHNDVTGKSREQATMTLMKRSTHRGLHRRYGSVGGFSQGKLRGWYR